MRFTTVQPIIQVAELKSVQDLEWLLKTVKAGKIFRQIIVQGYKNEQRYTSDSVSVDGNRLIHTGYESGYGNSVDEVKTSVASVGNFVVWNQNMVAYVVSGVRDNGEVRFSKNLIPQPLLANVVVELSND